MHHFFVPITAIAADEVLLDGAQAHQLSRVLRLVSGARIMVLDNLGQSYEVELSQVTTKLVRGRILNQQPAAGEPPVAITLYQGLLKRDKFEWVLQKGTEIGITRFVPLISRRSIVRHKEIVTPKRMTRWRRIIQEAAEQCRRGRLPELCPPLPWPATVTAPLSLVAWEEAPATATIRAALTAAQMDQPVTEVALFIGPEGGFAADEVAQLEAAGGRPITLGRRILRTETAAVVAAALLLYELDAL